MMVLTLVICCRCLCCWQGVLINDCLLEANVQCQAHPRRYSRYLKHQSDACSEAPTNEFRMPRFVLISECRNFDHPFDLLLLLHSLLRANLQDVHVLCVGILTSMCQEDGGLHSRQIGQVARGGSILARTSDSYQTKEANAVALG